MEKDVGQGPDLGEGNAPRCCHPLKVMPSRTPASLALGSETHNSADPEGKLERIGQKLLASRWSSGAAAETGL